MTAADVAGAKEPMAQPPQRTAYDAALLISQAQAADAADRQLTIMQALKKYKKAVMWSTLLSTALIMEGYDVVIVRPTVTSSLPSSLNNTLLTRRPRSMASSVSPNLPKSSATSIPTLANTTSRLHGNPDSRTAR
jgi:hypothetical protein